MENTVTTVTDYIAQRDAERQRAWNEASELVTTCATENREMSGEEREKYERIAGEGGALDTLAAEIKQLRERELTEREADIARSAYEGIVRPGAEGRQAEPDDAFDKFLRYGGAGNDEKNPHAWELDLGPIYREKAQIRAGMSPVEIRTTLNATTNTAGQYTIPTDLARVLYDYMENVSGVRQAGATVITTSGGNNLDLPIVNAHGTAAIVGEGTALAAADPAFTKVTLGAFKFGQLLQVTSELLQDTAVDLNAFIGKDMGRALGRVLETNYIRGSGTNAPQGACLAATVGTGVTTQTTATGVPSYADLVSLVYSVENIYRDGGASWLMQDSFAGVIRKLTDTTGQPLWAPGLTQGLQPGQPDRLLGYPMYMTPFLSAVGTAAGTPMAFGNFGDGFVIRDAGTVRIERSIDFAFSTDLVTIRAIVRTDSKVRDTRAIKVAKAPTT